MFANYLKIAVRNLIKQKSQTFISLFSLVVGMACFILLTLYARYELSYDSFFEHGDRVFRLGQYVPDWNFGGSNLTASTSGIIAPTLKEEFPEVTSAVRTKEVESPLVYGQKSILGKGLYADRDFLKMFAFPLWAGAPDTALAEPFSVVLTRTLAEKLFGGEDPLGRTVTYEKGRVLSVTGIVEDPPGNTHLKFDYLISFLTMYSLRDDIDTAWGIMNYTSYVQLQDGASAADFEDKLPAIVAKYHDPNSKDRRYFLTPLRDVHFATHVRSYSSPAVDKKDIALLVATAFLILVIACVNHVNLATARASGRGKEVGIRKTAGATRRQLTQQFLGESFILTFLGLLVSLAAVSIFLPAFNKIGGEEIPVRALGNWGGLAGLGGLFLAVGFLAGGYPALYLSTLKPLNVLKGSSGSRTSGGRRGFRNLLTVFQFGVTIVLVVAAVVIQKQLLFIRNRDIGYDRKNVVAVRTWNDESRENPRAIKNELLKNPLIAAAAVANTAPLRLTEANNIKVETEAGDMADLPMVTTYFIDEDYLGLMGMKLAAGRNFSRALAADLDKEAIINETAARLAGLKDPVGKKILKWGREMRVIGVVEDFNFTSFKSKIEPLMFSYEPERSNLFLIKIAGHHQGETLAYIDATFRRFSRNFAFDHAFLDDLYNGLYKNEKSLGGIILGFSIVTMVIAAVGLYGLVSFVVARKTKEIGVRKVLGASVLSVMGLVLKKFFVLIGLALLISLPIAYYFTQEWLKGFVYRIDLKAGLFVFSAFLILIVALVSVAGQTVKAALANPAESLKQE
ncbi:MAG: ABC transporter permease [Candidatus Aminicenantes bacterium]|nr:ABC transporter permease [Candidatus Aminicenantes bacterium]